MQTGSAAKIVSRIFLTLLLVAAILPAPAQAQTFTVLHTFKGAPNDGALPLTQLVLEGDSLYGTTSEAGEEVCGNAGCGTAFRLNKNGMKIYSFNGKNGMEPAAGLLRDAAGNFYGTTVEGGDTACFELGCGTVFKLSSTGKETVLYEFTGGSDGFFPESLLVGDAEGNLYGTTSEGGGSPAYGTVFKVDAKGETILHSFAGPPSGGGDGAYSYEGVIRDAAGNLYGVTAAGGTYGAGVVYKLDASANETLLYSFSGGPDGGGPDSVLLADASGNLYGTTQAGGNLNCEGGTGCGVVFELSPQPGGTWTKAVLYTFCSQLNCTDGERPSTGPLVRDGAGNLYGTTYFGGTSTQLCNGTCGVVFKLDASGKETVLHSFAGGADGAAPDAGLTMDGAGNLYGTAELGADTMCAADKQGCGVVFKITP
jgi:uncharacterized repeat protein (TIGR03803 family)